MNKIYYTVEYCAIVVLAAGKSSRLGSPKQLLAYKDKSLLRHSVDEALETKFRPVVVVVGANSDTVEKETEGMEVDTVYNEEWQEGIASSLRSGLTAVQNINDDVDGIIIMVCDQPFVSSLLLNDLVNKQRETGKPIVTCNYGETIGPPALFHKSFFPELMKLNGDAGARKIIKEYSNEVATILFPKGNIDIDTRNDYEKLIQKE